MSSNSSVVDVGVYYGGSSMVIAYVGSTGGGSAGSGGGGGSGANTDKVSVIVNEAGYRSTPAVLALNENEFSVGLPAKHNLIRNATNTILHAKHLIGKRLEHVDQYFLDRSDCEVVIFVRLLFYFHRNPSHSHRCLYLDEGFGRRTNRVPRR